MVAVPGHFYSLLVPSISPSTLTVAPGFVTSPPTHWTASAMLLTCSCGHPDMHSEHTSFPCRDRRTSALPCCRVVAVLAIPLFFWNQASHEGLPSAPGFVTSPLTHVSVLAKFLTCSSGHLGMYAQHTSGQSGSTRGGRGWSIGAVSEIVETAPRLPVTHVHSELVIRFTTAARRTAAHVAKSRRTRHQLQGSHSEGR